MSTNILGIRNNNTIIPISAITKQTKWIDFGSYVSANKTGDANVRCLARFEADSNNKWFMNFTFVRSHTAATVSFTYLTVSDVKFKNTAEFYQIVIPFFIPDASARIGYASPTTSGNNGVITVQFCDGATANIAGVGASGYIELEEEPITYTTAANMEGVANVAAYFPSAAAGIQGLVDNRVANVAGTPLLGKTDGAAVAAGYVGEFLDVRNVGSCATSGNTAIASLTLTVGTWIISAATLNEATASGTGYSCLFNILGVAGSAFPTTRLDVNYPSAKNAPVTFTSRVIVVASGTATKTVTLTGDSVGATQNIWGYITAIRIA